MKVYPEVHHNFLTGRIESMISQLYEIAKKWTRSWHVDDFIKSYDLVYPAFDKTIILDPRPRPDAPRPGAVSI